MDVMNWNDALEAWVVKHNTIGIPDDQAKYLFCLVLAYPLSFLYSLLPNYPKLKHVTGIVLGVWFGWFIMRWEILHSLFSSSVVYLLMRFGPKGYVHKIAVAFAILYMSVGHIHRMWVDYGGWRMDFSGVQLLLTIKFTTFALDVYDGQRPEEKLTEYQKKHRIRRVPSVLEWFGYIYFFPGFLTGPAFNLCEYLALTDYSLFKDAPNGRQPSAIKPALLAFLGAAVCGAGTVLGGQFPASFMRDPEYHNHHSFLYRVLYMQISTALCRFPYYFAWIMSEGACNLSGIGFSGYNKHGQAIWERATNVHPFRIETAQNYRAVSENWNVRTDRWLKHYVYERFGNTGTLGVLLTFGASAVWHGFYPGYYFSFATAALFVRTARVLRRNLRPRFMEADQTTPKSSKWVYDLFSWVVTWPALNYNFAAFMILSFEGSLFSYRSVYFFGHVAWLVIIVLATLVGPPRKPRGDTKKE